jgi:hypothetical protein
VFRVLRDALATSEAGVSSETTTTFESSVLDDSPTSQAIDGLGTLLTRPEWRSAHGAELTTILTAYLEDPNPALRARATYRLLWVYPDPADALKQIEQRLSIEDVPAIQWALINALAAVARTAPLEVDAAIGRLATQSRWSAIASSLTDDTRLSTQDPADLLVKLIAELDVVAATPIAHGLLSAWLSNPMANPQRVVRVATWVGLLINPPGGGAPGQQDRRFTLLRQAASAVSHAWQNVTSNDTKDSVTSGQRAEVETTVEVADEIAKQIYFASGAMPHTGSGEPRRGDADQFATYALPVFDDLASIPHPRVTHHIIETLSYLLQRNIEPRRCYLVAANAVRPDSGYEYEVLAVQEVMKLIDHFVADHHDLLLEPDCLSATRHLLAVFIRAGWDDAIRRALELDTAFR